MKLIKKRISENIKKNTNLNMKESEDFVNKFFNLIKDNTKSKIIKIANFGSFSYKYTPKRIGRNPKTGITYTIKPFYRLTFKASFKLKNYLNWYNN